MQKRNQIESQIIEKEEIPRIYSILIAEDEYVNYYYLEELLRIFNPDINVIHATNGQEAVELCNDNIYDLILMDIKMPVVNGLEAAKRIKELHPDIKIVAQTAYSTPEERRKTLDAGCDDFIAKPIKYDILSYILNKYLYIKND